jgi:hypothetical protein
MIVSYGALVCVEIYQVWIKAHTLVEKVEIEQHIAERTYYVDPIQWGCPFQPNNMKGNFATSCMLKIVLRKA